MNANLRYMLRLTAKLTSEDEAERTSAEAKILARGPKAIGSLRYAAGRRGYSQAEIYRLLGIIGDDCTGKSRKTLVDVLKSAVTTTFQPPPPEAKAVARAVLERWGVEIPERRPPKAHPCARCGRKAPSVKVRTCYLPGCRTRVCEEHSVQFDIGRSPWFCCGGHRAEAAADTSILM